MRPGEGAFRCVRLGCFDLRKQRFEVVTSKLHAWVMIRQTGLPDSKRAAHQGLGFGKPVRGLKQHRQIVEVSGHIGMLRAEAFLVDGECAALQGLGLRKTVRVLKQLRQIVQVYGHIGMTGAEAFLIFPPDFRVARLEKSGFCI